MVHKKKSREHALKMRRKSEQAAWTPETVNKGIASYINGYLSTPPEKASNRHTHLTNIYRGFHSLLASEFGRTEPKTRLVLADYADEYVVCSGVAVLTKDYGKGYKLLLSTPHLEEAVIGQPRMDNLLTRKINGDRKIDSHIWLDLDQVKRTNKSSLNTILFGEVVTFVAKVSPYRGKTTSRDNYRGRGYKYGLTDITLIDVLSANFKGDMYEANMMYRLDHTSGLGLIKYDNQKKVYLPIETEATSLPNKVANNKNIPSMIAKHGRDAVALSLFTYQVYMTDDKFKRKVDEYNAKYPEDTVVI